MIKYMQKILHLLVIILLLLIAGCESDINIADIQQDTFYYGTVGNREMIIKVNHLNGKLFDGDYYDISQNSTVNPIEFHGKIKRNKCVVSFLDKKMSIQHIQWKFSDNRFTGSCKIDGEEYDFQFTAYTAPEFKKYKNRYKEPIYEYNVIKNVKYSTATGYWTSNPTTSTDYFEIIKNGLSSSIETSTLALTMDIYLPKNDYLSRRPLLMLIHGGGFYIGDKADAPIVRWCNHFASLGYVVASINYRMGFKPAKQSIERCGYRATQDAHAAMRFLLANQDKFKIDPNYLFAAGSSAGGITTLNLAFMRNKNRPESSHGNWVLEDLGDIESSGNTLKQTFHLRAIANMWGAVHDINEIANSNTSIISFHGDADQVVPYDYDVPFKDIQLGFSKLFFNKMYGSAAIHRKAKELGYRQTLHTFPGAGHAPHVDKNDNPTEKFWFIQKEMTDFFYREFLPRDVVISSKQAQVYTIDISNPVRTYWKAEGGLILSSNSTSARVVWLKSDTPHKLSVAGYLENGAAFFTEQNF